MINHDLLFKELLTNFTAEFLQLLVPELYEAIEPGSLELLQQEVVIAGEDKPDTKKRKRITDLVLKARLRGQEAAFLIHGENQGRPETGFPERMFRYFPPLFVLYGLPIYPIAIFSYDTPRNRVEKDEYRMEFPGFTSLIFRFRVIQLNRLNWRDFLANPNPVAAALMAKMRIAPEDRPKVKLECLRMLAKLRLDPDKARIITGFVDTYLPLNATEEAEFEREAAKVLPKQEKEQVMKITTSWERKGIQQGQAQVIQLMLKKRFGRLPKQIQAHIQQLSVKQLEEIAVALLDFQNLEEVQEWLKQHPVPTEALPISSRLKPQKA